MDRKIVALTIVSGLAALLWVRSASAEPKLIEERRIEGWTLSLIAEDSSDYAVCSIDRDNGYDKLLLSVMVERPSRVWSLTVSAMGDDEPFRIGAAYSFTYMIDDGAPVTVRAKAIGGRTVAIPLDDALAESLRRSARISFRARQGGAAVFSLAGSRRALDALRDCASRHLGFATAAPQGGATATPAPKPDSTAALTESLRKTIETTSSPAVEALLVGEIFLQEGHLAGYAEPLDTQSPDQIEGYDVTWTLPKAKAGFLVLDDVTTDSAAAYLLEVSKAVEKGCSTAARTELPSELAPGILGRLHVYCEGEPSAMFIFFHRPRGGMYQMLVLGDPGPEGRIAAEQYDKQIVEVFTSGAQ